MYPASDAFHRAVYEPNPSERVLITMPGLGLYAEDLMGSLKFTEPYNEEEELTVGECPSSTLECKVRNDHGLLSDYDFTAGECRALLGVRTGEEPGQAELPYVRFRYGMENELTIQGRQAEPYLLINGAQPTMQPPFPVHAMVMDGNKLYCAAEDGLIWGAAWVDGYTWNALAARSWEDLSQEQWDGIQGFLAPLQAAENWDSLAAKTWNEIAVENLTWGDMVSELDMIPFMRTKFKKWAAAKRGVWHNGLVTYEFGETVERYEYVPLGTFLPEQPKKRRASQIAIAASDRMIKFDRDAGAFLAGLAYPVSLGALLSQLCEYVGVPLATATFINSTRILDEAPFEGEQVTCRELLRWIAEAACAYGRMTRDGELELAWYSAKPVDIPMNQYFDIDVAEYEVQPIDKLQILGSESDIGVIIGDGDNGYQIMDNPCLYGDSDAEIRPLGVPIFNRLEAFAPFRPITARAVCDWAIRPGDMISITLNGISYPLPVYRQVITWNGGGARVNYENTGAPRRPVMSQSNRRVFNQKKAMHEISETVDGITRRIVDAEGNIANMQLSVDGLSVEISNKVGDDEIISKINQSAEQVSILAERISLEGIVTANSRFKILLDGSMEASNGKFSGELNASSGTIAGFKISGDALTSSSFEIDPYGIYWPSLRAGIGEGTNTGLRCSTSLEVSGSFIASYLYMGNYSSFGSSYAPNVRVDIDNGQLYRTSYDVSSVRYKTDIRPLADWKRVLKLEPIVYRLRDDPAGRELLGLVAEDAHAVFPEIVEVSEDNYGNVYPEAVEYDRLTLPLLAAVKDLERRVTIVEEQYGAV